MIEIATSLAAVAAPYSVLFCDVWGVIHNGVSPFPLAVKALEGARARGKLVLLISNSPRLASAIPAQLRKIGVSDKAYDLIVTSGDASRAHVKRWLAGGLTRLYYIGPDRDAALFEGLSVERVELADAQGVVCTGPFHDDTETPNDYAETLADIARRKLPFLCANPDLVVQRGERLIYCAGALAERLERLGGAAIYCGKPHMPIYELSLASAQERLGRAVAKSEILTIGDGLKTDLLGATRFGIASLLIADGIHADVLMCGENLDAAAVETACREVGVRPIAAMRQLTE